MPTVVIPKPRLREGVKGQSSQRTTIKMVEPYIEILVGGPYKDHTYGHAALRVVTNDKEVVYDYGRYGKKWGAFNSEGEGILRVWSNAKQYIFAENSYGRETKGFVYIVSDEKANSVIKFFDGKISGKHPISDSESMKTYRIEDYEALRRNCTTMTVDGAKIAIPNLDGNRSKFNKGNGLSFTEKGAARVKGWPNFIFMPDDLKCMLEEASNSKPNKTNIYHN